MKTSSGSKNSEYNNKYRQRMIWKAKTPCVDIDNNDKHEKIGNIDNYHKERVINYWDTGTNYDNSYAPPNEDLEINFEVGDLFPEYTNWDRYITGRHRNLDDTIDYDKYKNMVDDFDNSEPIDDFKHINTHNIYKKKYKKLEEIATNKCTDYNWQHLTSSKEGLDIIKANNAHNYIGRKRIVEGYVPFVLKHDKILFIDFLFPPPYYCFNIVILKEDWHKFPKGIFKSFCNKILRVKGLIKEYKRKPYIKVCKLSQIEFCYEFISKT